MIFNLYNPLDRESAKVYFDKLLQKECKIELTEKQKQRTINQNSLFHLWVAVFAEHIGELNLDTVKRDVKRTLLGTVEVVNRFTGEVQRDDFKTHGMDTGQLSSFMDKFKAWAQSDFGCYLPYVFEPGYEQMMDFYKNRYKTKK